MTRNTQVVTYLEATTQVPEDFIQPDFNAGRKQCSEFKYKAK